VDAADALWRREEQTAVAFESGRLKAAGISEEAGLNLRVLAAGRMGVAGTTAAARTQTSWSRGRVPPPRWERSSSSPSQGLRLAAAPIPTFFDRTPNASLAT